MLITLTSYPPYPLSLLGLMKFLADNAPGAIREQDIKAYFGRKIAIDASMCLYQFLIAVRAGPEQQNLTDAQGEVTSHLQGMFYRTLRMMDNGIKPIYVFDGKAPELKSGELEKRKERRAEAQEDLKQAIEGENKEDIHKFERRLVHVTRQHNEDVKKLLKLMGVPYVEAPGEAEATCAAMAKAGLVYATGTEDMDALTFGTPKLVRNLTAAEARELPIVEIDLQKVLNELDLTMEEFTDLCILLGCDYTGTIKGVGPQKAHEVIRDHRSIEKGIEALKEKYTIPEDFMYKEAAKLFHAPDVADVEKLELKWTAPDEQGLIDFLVTEKGFALERVQKGLERLKKAKQTGTQQRLENFFTVIPSAGVKRKADGPAGGKKGAPAAKKLKK